MQHSRTKYFFKKGNNLEMTLSADCNIFYLNFYSMLRSTWNLLYFAFHTAVVLVGAVFKAPPPVSASLSTTRTIVILFAFVPLSKALGVAGVHHDKVICNFWILREYSRKWKYHDQQDKFHHFQGSWSLFSCSFWFCRIEK